MTSPLRRKRRTTARGRSTLPRMAASLVGLGLFLAAGPRALAQSPGFQMPPPPAATGRPGTTDEQPEYQIQLEPPGPDRLFRVDSEDVLRERMRQEARQRSPMERIVFPEEPIVGREPYKGRLFPEMKEIVEP